MTERRSLRVGIDVGGTFTDLVAIESWSGKLATRKLASTPREPQRAVTEALRDLLAGYEQPPAIEFLAHATTIATNALLGQLTLELPRVALITTEGFRDVIEIGRQNRSEVYNLFVERPRPLVARDDRLTVIERIDYRGEVLVPLDDASVQRACALLRERGVAAVAVCLLHAYANDEHERRVAGALAAALPGVPVTRSSALDPEYREYERFSTTVVNAALAPIVERYLERLVADLRGAGIGAPLYVMRSDGGMAAAEHVSTRPAALIESGPASGAIATAALGERLGIERLLSFDMGGTTAKCGAVIDGRVQVVTEFEAAGKTHSGRAIKGSGYPVRFPFVDLAEVSAGGGTIAWIDDAGSLRVGPLSAGADPGPACYGTSELATVTDANVLLGRLNQHHLLGGTFPIDAARSRSAVGQLAKRLGMSDEIAAAGIVTLVDDAMAKVLRIVTVERGLDPRDFTLVAFGGGGPLHACALAGELGIARVFVPAHPGLFSARGLLFAPLVVNELRPVLQSTGEFDHASLEQAFADGEARCRELLLAQGADAGSITFARRYDARYRGQSFELSIDHGRTPELIEQHFHRAHRARYGYDVPEEVVELVNARLTACGGVSSAGVSSASVTPSPSERESRRRVWVDGAFTDVPVVARKSLAPGASLEGPAIVEGYDSTTYVAPEWSLRVHDDALQLLRGER